MAVSKSVRLGPSPGTSVKNKITPGDGTGIRVCLRSRILWVRVPPGRLWRYAGAWLIGPVLKTVGEKSHEGSNPSTSSKCICSLIGRVRCYERRCDIGSTPIRCTNKCGYIIVWSNEPVYQTGYLGSNPSSHLRLLWWRIRRHLNKFPQ